MNREQKTEVVEQWRERFSSATATVIVDYKGLSAANMTDLRKQCKESGVYFGIVKNTLARLALEGSSIAKLAEDLKGPMAIAVTPDSDQTQPARVLTKFAKDNEALEVKFGTLGGEVLDSAGVEELAKLPSMDELRGQLLSLFLAVPQKFVRLLNEVPSGLVRVLEARRQKQEEA